MVAFTVMGAGWDSGTVAPRPDRPLARATLVLLVAVVAAAVVAAEFAAGGRVSLGPGSPQPGAAPPAGTAPPPAEVERLFSLDGTAPEAAPKGRTAAGFLALGDPLERAVDVLGPPERIEPDIDETLSHTWRLPGAATLSVSATQRPPERIAGLFIQVPPGSPVRMPLYGGVTPGRSTVDETIQRWGPGYTTGTHPGDDFAVRYVHCAGPYPVVVKFDVDRSATAGEVSGDETVTSVLLAYADADPGTEGCPAV